MKLGIYSVSSSAITLLTLHRNGNLFLAAYGFTFFVCFTDSGNSGTFCFRRRIKVYLLTYLHKLR